MVIYSVTLNIDEEVHEDWLNWMKNHHIPDVMSCGIFKEHRFLKVLSRNDGEEGYTYNIQYSCPSMKELDRYQKEYAPKLQEEHQQRYENKFVAFRTLLEEA